MGEAKYIYFTCLKFVFEWALIKSKTIGEDLITIMLEKGRILEVAMGGIFLLSGLSKLLPIASMVEQFDQFAEHFPLGLKPPGWLFLRSVGVAEVIGGYLLLSQCPNPVKIIAASSMMTIMVGAWHTLYAVGEDAAMFVPSV